jgi:RimJ/RimL family protein N-acetyltransferase/catechol 2,3-dioxygenase-like lactoylglutathione lyase family enzyme
MSVETTDDTIRFQLLDQQDVDFLAGWLASDRWPFHGTPAPDLVRARELIVEKGFLDDCLAFWLIQADEHVGLVRLTEISDPTPMLDIRIRTAHRGRGLGTAGLRWITAHLFSTRSDKIRIEGQTRRDNLAMRRTFRKCGYVKEAHYRRCWPGPDGVYHDSIGYGILRSDWDRGEATPPAWDDEPGAGGGKAGSPASVHFAHANLIAHDWEVLAAFYVSVFGCERLDPVRDQTGEWLDKGTGVKNARIRGQHLRLPGHGRQAPTLEIYQYQDVLPQPAPAANRAGFGHIAFAVDDVARALRAVVAGGGRPHGEIVQTSVEGVGDLSFTYARDPEGNLIELQSWTRGPWCWRS